MALFELGQAYRGDRAGGSDDLIAAGVRAGTAQLAGSGRHWSGSSADADVFDVKADVIAVLAALGFDAGKAQITRDAPAWYHPGRSGTLRLGPKVVLAHFGEVHPATLKALDVHRPGRGLRDLPRCDPAREEEQRAAAARRRRPAAGDARLRLRPRPRDAGRRCGQGGAGADKALDLRCQRVRRVRRRQPCRADKKSLAIEVTLQPTEKTLTDKDIEAIAADRRRREEGDRRRDPRLTTPRRSAAARCPLLRRQLVDTGAVCGRHRRARRLFVARAAGVAERLLAARAGETIAVAMPDRVALHP